LDLESVSALADGITGYEGTVVFATHDRDLLDKAATKIIAFEEKGPVFFSGPYEEYLLSKK
jgi:ATPase subunit of ABC transporter with duplicated ATPase domains